MGYRELFLVLVSIVLLSMLMTQINTNVVQGREALQQIEIEHAAASIAQQYIEEAKSKLFDAQIPYITDPSTMPGSFTPASGLGHGSWEIYPNYNDVDDYNYFSTTRTENGIDFTVSIRVQYVEDSNPEVAVSYRTFFKRMTVTVSSSWLPRSLVLKHIFSYFGVKG
ncbi:MAG: hypothetical protein ONB44_02020 [candidate division KSB1 bacterium]|nr:hypothetical protein [candidate division KSB1 bacterium]MDZ7309831.1 hypothetical protein [candidate division KSB1 bacterium]